MLPADRPSVSVLIPTFNRAQYLAECVDSVLGQSLPPAQVIVIDDGSDDDTRQVAESYGGRIEYLRKSNGGKSSALNMGMARVRGAYVWVMDDDDIAVEDALERHLGLLESRPEVDFTYGGHIVFSTDADGRSVEREMAVPDIPAGELLARMLESCLFPQPSAVVRRRCYERVGPFDERLVRSQDYEMLLRLCRRFRGARIEGPTFRRRLHEGDRGSRQDRFSARHSLAKWQYYDRGIFLRLWQELPVEAYLPAGEANRSGGLRRAHLQRMKVMALRGLREEMLQDLRTAFDQHGRHGLSVAERQIFRTLAVDDDGFLQLIKEPGALEYLREASCPHSEIRTALFKGLYWGLVRSVQRGDLRAAADRIGTFLRVAKNLYNGRRKGDRHEEQAAADG